MYVLADVDRFSSSEFRPGYQGQGGDICAFDWKVYDRLFVEEYGATRSGCFYK